MMPTRHLVREGEGTTSISELYGFRDETIWNDPANDALRAKRSDLNALLPGDELVIPDLRPKVVACATGARHRFRRRGIPPKYRVQLIVAGRPVADRPFELVIDGSLRITGNSTAEGVVETFLPAAAKTGVLRVDRSPDAPAIVLKIAFGRIEPIEETGGVRNRLTNLGYDCTDLRSALLLFQRRHAIAETGEADDATRAKLAEVHDSPALAERS